jgi:hypothetical protein
MADRSISKSAPATIPLGLELPGFSNLAATSCGKVMTSWPEYMVDAVVTATASPTSGVRATDQPATVSN